MIGNVVIDLGRSEGSLIQVTGKATEQIVKRETGAGTRRDFNPYGVPSTFQIAETIQISC